MSPISGKFILTFIETSWILLTYDKVVVVKMDISILVTLAVAAMVVMVVVMVMGVMVVMVVMVVAVVCKKLPIQIFTVS